MSDAWYDAFFGEDYARFDDHPDTAREVRFLRDVLPDPGTRILDLACGTGRHAVRLARAGYRVVGVDRSAALLSHARRTRAGVSWVRGDVRGIPLADRTCGGVISMFSSIGYFDDERDNWRVLAEMARVLMSGGRLVIETANRDFLIRHSPPQSWFEEGGLVVLESRDFDPVESRSEVDVIVIDGTERRTYHHSIRLYAPAEIAMLLAANAVDTLEVFGGFDGRPLTVDDSRMIVVGERR